MIALAFAALLLAAGSAHAADIVDDLATCPTKGKPFPKAVFDVDNVGGMLPLLVTAQAEGKVTQACVDLGVDQLATCAADGTLALQAGCCTSACAAGLKKADGCLLSYVKAVCADKVEGPKYREGLFSAARRCVGLEASCAGGGRLAKAGKAAAAGAGAAATAAAAAKNVTAAAVERGVKNATAAVAGTDAAAAAPAAAAPAPSGAAAAGATAAVATVVATLAFAF